MKVAWKIALNILPKKCLSEYQKIRRIQWQNMLRIASKCISYNLEFQNFQGEDPRTLHLPERGKPPSRALPHLRLWRSVRASGTQLSPYYIN